MTRRVLRTELLRGTAPLAAAATALCGGVLLFGRLAEWGGRWGALAGNMRTNLIVLVPLAVAAGAWQAGRERRRGVGELLTSVPRASWHRHVLAWAAVTAATVTGASASFAVGGLLVAPVATYAGGDWPWLLLGAVPALAAAVAVGALAGSMVPGRLVPPVAGLAAYVGLGVLTYLGTRVTWLSPAVFGANGQRGMPVATHLGQAVLFTSVAATALVLAVGRRRWLAAGPAASAVLAALALTYGPAAGSLEADPAANELVCAEGEPVVCVTRLHMFLLDDVTPHARTLLARLEDVPGAPRRVVEILPDQGPWRLYTSDGSGQRAVGLAAGDPARGEAATVPHLPVWLGTQADVRGRIRDADELLVDLAAGLFPYWCEAEDGFPDMQWWSAAWVAHEWLLHGLVDQPPLPAEQAALAERLLTRPAAGQRAWMGRYLAAAADCNGAAREALLSEL